MVFIYISLFTNDVEKWVIVILIFSIVNSLVKSFAPFYWAFFLFLRDLCYLYILKTKRFVKYIFRKISIQFIACLFIILLVTFEENEIQLNILFFSFKHSVCSFLKQYCLPKVANILFPPGSFIVLICNPAWINFCVWCELEVKVRFTHLDVQLS